MKHMGRCSTLGLCATLLALGPSAQAQVPRTTSASPAPAPPPEADRLYDEGRAEAKAGHLDKARDLYLRSWRIRKHWQVAASLGRIEHDTGKFRDAAEHLSYFLKEAPKGTDEAVRRAGQEMLDRARAKVGALSITVNQAGAEVLVDGVVVGKAPLGEVLFVEPGPVFVEARLEKFAATKVSRVGMAGTVENVDLRLVLESTKPVGVKGGPSDAKSGPNLVVLVAGGALGLATLGLGVAGAVMEKTKRHERGDTMPDICPPSDCSYNRLERERANWARASFAGFLGFGAIGAATIAYGIVETMTKTADSNRVSVAISIDASGGQATISSKW